MLSALLRRSERRSPASRAEGDAEGGSGFRSTYKPDTKAGYPRRGGGKHCAGSPLVDAGDARTPRLSEGVGPPYWGAGLAQTHRTARQTLQCGPTHEGDLILSDSAQYKPGDIANGHRLTEQPDGSMAWLPVQADPAPVEPERYNPGDIANGHRLTARPDGSLVWLPLADEAKPKKSRRGLWITLGAVGAILLFIIIVGNLGRANRGDTVADEPAPAAVEEPEVAADAPSVEPEPEPAPAADAGTAANPLPQPYVAEGIFAGSEKYSLTAGINGDGVDVTQYNQFNTPAPAGFKWVIVELTMTGIDPDGVEPSLASWDLTLATPEGNQYNEESTVLGEGMPHMYDGPTLYPGSAFTGFMSFVVPEGATGFMLHDNGNYIALG